MDKIFNRQLKRDFEAWLYLLPCSIIFFVLTLFPLCSIFFDSFYKVDYRNAPVFKGLYYFSNLFSGSEIYTALKVTGSYMVIVIPSVIILSIAVASLFNSKLYGIGIIRTLYIIPYISNFMAVITVFMALYRDDSFINQLIRNLGFNPPIWLFDDRVKMFAVCAPTIWAAIGFYSIIFLSGLQSIPNDLYESAKIDGANAWKKFSRITLPLLSPQIFLVIVVMTIWGLRAFTQFYGFFTSSSGKIPPDMKPMVGLLYEKAMSYGEYSASAAIGVVIFVISIILVIIQRSFEKRWVYYN